MTAQLCRMRREDGFDPHVFTSDVQYGQASHPFVKMRDDRPVGLDQGDEFVQEHLDLECQGNDVIDERVVSRHADPVILPEQVLDYVERLGFNDMRIEQYHAWPSGDEPFSVMHIIALVAKSRGSLSEDVCSLVEGFEFR